MKILTTGDSHGKSLDSFMSQINNYDKLILVGDYVDSFVVNDADSLENLNKLIQFKKDNLDKVILLWGNHDLHYLLKDEWPLMRDFQSSGYNEFMAQEYCNLFKTNYDLFLPAYLYEGYLWSHAGITKEAWCYYFEYKPEFRKYPIDVAIKKLFDNLDESLFKVGIARGGRDVLGSIFWTDATEFQEYGMLQGYHQIVGHTAITSRRPD